MSDGVMGHMPQTRPKLLIVDGPHVPTADLIRRLGDQYDIEVVEPDEVTRIGHETVLGDAAGVAPLAGTRSSALLNALGDAACLVALDGSVVWSNVRFRDLEAQSQRRVSEMCADAGRWFRAHLREPADAEVTRKFEVTGEGPTFYEMLATPVTGRRADSGEPVVEHVAAVIRDVTRARRIQQKMDAIDRAGRELVRIEAEMIERMNVVDRLRFLEDKIVRYSRDLLQFDHFAIRLIDRKAGTLDVVISSGLPPELADLKLYPSREGNGISGYVAATGRSYICHDTRTDARFIGGLHGAGSSLTVPLRLHDKVIGILDVESQQYDAFDEDDRQSAEIFARYIALALHMLDLLVVERCATNESVSCRFEGELNEPLDDLEEEARRLEGVASLDPEAARHLKRMLEDIAAIRRRVKEVALGPKTLLGVDRALAESERDPVLVGRRVLVVDDEPKIRRIIGDVLGNRGCEVELCETGQCAVDMLRAATNGDGRAFDLVISDIRLTDKNGYEVFSEAKKALPDVAVILMTGFGYDPHHSIVRASQEGLQSVLFKPFQVERLLDEVREALGREA